MRLPQCLRPVPHRQHNAETYDRTDHSESEAIIYGLGIHFFATVTSVGIVFGTSTQTTDQRANWATAAVLFLINPSWITRQRNSPLVLPFWYPIPCRFIREYGSAVNSDVLKGKNKWRDSNENDKYEHDPRPRIAEIERVPDAQALLYKQRWVGGINIENASLPAAVWRAVVATRKYRHENSQLCEQCDGCENKQD